MTRVCSASHTLNLFISLSLFVYSSNNLLSKVRILHLSSSFYERCITFINVYKCKLPVHGSPQRLGDGE